jgi:hypothetical protein
MSERLVRKVAIAALKGERGEGGWLKIDAPEATDKEISLAILAAEERGVVAACYVGNHQSDYPEWKLAGPTGATEQFIRETRVSKKVWAGAITIGAIIVGFLAWLIPVLISMTKE